MIVLHVQRDFLHPAIAGPPGGIADDVHQLAGEGFMHQEIDAGCEARQIVAFRGVARDDDGLADVAFKTCPVADNLHGAPTQHVGRADNHRVSDPFGNRDGFFSGFGDAVVGLDEFELLQQPCKSVAVFGQIDGVR